MRPGDVLGERFEIERVAGAGGMGTVYRGIDRASGQPVAVKVLRVATGDAAARLLREASVLASLRHPSVVRYVGHGSTAEAQPYLAMEWLDGELLSVRLARKGLTVEEALEVCRRVAAGLSAAHALGLVHRDIKPSNVFLVDGRAPRAKVLDFGLARPGVASSITGTGHLVGTPGYMAPEQARGAKQLDARADVFSLGCLLYKCLTGRPPFEAEDAVAVLARILFDEPKSVRLVRPEIPVEVASLLGRMLAKAIEDRPPDGAAVHRELDRLHASVALGEPPESFGADLLTGGEKRLVSVIVVLGSDAAQGGATVEHVAWEAGENMAERIATAAAPFGVKLELLADQSVVATLSGDPTAADQAVRAARCALAIRTTCPSAPMAVATGMGELTGAGSVGAVVDRAAGLLRGTTNGAGASAAPIYLDESTARLLDARYETRGQAPLFELVRERAMPLEVRTLLGRPTPCVGRERELSSIRAVLEECASEPAARVVLLTAPSGLGKSRIRHEIVRELVREGRFDTWIARGEALTAGSAFAMLGQALRSALGIAQDSRGPGAAGVLRARVARSVPVADVARVSEFLGELIGVPFGDEESVQLRAARRDAHLMGDQTRRAFEDFLGAECAKRPVLLVLEDLHLCDFPTVSFVDSALRNLHERPLMVLALARPEVQATFPRLWEGRAMLSMPLSPLSRKAAERLLVAVLGDAVDPTVAQSLVTRAGGNVFFLEELIRAVAEGQADRLPETVLATAQNRLESLETEERRILRAASVFGQTFWDEGVAALVTGGTHPEEDPRARLDDLARKELVTSRAQSKLAGTREYVFRHAIVQEAAYGMLTDHDRVLGHRLAASWLEKAGETDALALAEHWERAEEPARAVVHYLRAARQALEGHDDLGVITGAERAVRAGASGEALGEARLLQVEAHRWRGQFEEAERCGLEALSALPPGHPRRFAMVAALVPPCGQLGHDDVMLGLLEDARSATGTIGLLDRVAAICRGAAQLLSGGRLSDAAPLFEWLDAHGEAILEDPATEAVVHFARAMQGLVAGDPSAHLERSLLAVQAYERAGDRRNACIQAVNVGYAEVELGAYVDAERVLRDAMVRSRRMGLENAYADATQNLGYALAMLGRTEEACEVEAASIESFVQQKLPRMEAGGRGCLALIHALAGNFVLAEEQALRAVEVAARLPPTRAFALATLARARLGKKNADGALEAATAAMEILAPLGGIEFGEALIRLVHAEALEAVGDRGAASSAIRAARQRLIERAARISNEEARERFLRGVGENRMTLELADAWA